MTTDVLIIGQGISGTFLSWYLQQQRISFCVIDDNKADSPSKIAAGIINPVTGRRLVTVWLADEVLPFAWQAYTAIGDQLGITAISQKNILDFFPNPFMRESFLKKIQEKDTYVSLVEEEKEYPDYFRYEFGIGQIKPVYTAHLDTLLPAWRSHLLQQRLLIDDHFSIAELSVLEDGIVYKDIHAKQIIFCDGPACADNPYFKNLPFAPNKGEALIVEIPGLPNEFIYKKSMLLAPLQEKDLFWLGSNYLWEFDNPYPSPEFYKDASAYLQHFLRIPFNIREHLAGLRPATLERRPFVGFHPLHKRIGIFNGMGTKGCSLAPYFAQQLAAHIHYQAPITREADVTRFTKILSRT